MRPLPEHIKHYRDACARALGIDPRWMVELGAQARTEKCVQERDRLIATMWANSMPREQRCSRLEIANSLNLLSATTVRDALRRVQQSGWRPPLVIATAMPVTPPGALQPPPPSRRGQHPPTHYELVHACLRLRAGKADARDAELVRRGTCAQVGAAWAATSTHWYKQPQPARRSA